MAVLALFGGPAGAGKSTLARAWCATRPRAAHIELDRVRELIVAGRADPQETSDPRQAAQYDTSVRACIALARAFLADGYDVAVDDTLPPDAFARVWRPLLAGLDWRLAIILPSLDETLARSRAREKRVLERHTRDQHATSLRWPESLRIDTTGMVAVDALMEVRRVLRDE